jgi:hypothetical protein
MLVSDLSKSIALRQPNHLQSNATMLNSILTPRPVSTLSLLCAEDLMCVSCCGQVPCLLTGLGHRRPLFARQERRR